MPILVAPVIGSIGMRGLIACVALLAGCYQDRASCMYTCATSGLCPSGLVCSAGNCVAHMGDTCTAGGDGGSNDGPTDGSTIDFNFAIWPYPPANFDPANMYITAGGPDWPVMASLTYDTDGTPPTGTPPVLDTQLGGVNVRVIRVGVFTLGNNINLTVAGSRPLIVVATSADLNGTIFAQSGSGNATVTSCVARSGKGNGACASGGAGGAFGGRGGDGGGCQGLAVEPGQVADGTSTLEPLRGGCAGGNGGDKFSANGAPGGPGGGAIQISVHDTLAMTGSIVAGGVRGRGNSSPQSGGAGAGAGGGVILEASLIMLTSARICAEGGGGGGGGGGGFGGDGRDGCDPSGSGLPGPAGGGTAGAGGRGAVGNIVDGANGVTANGPVGGGGGGGATGRIRLRAKAFQNMSPVIAPPPRMDTL